jgi:hypothetical protein
MNRRIAAWTIAAVAVLGLAACSGPSSTAAGTKPASGSSAPAEDTQAESSQSIADACAIAGAKIQEATDAFSTIDMAAAQSDPQGTVEEFTAIVDAIGEATESVSNADVKSAMTAFHEDYASLRDVLQKVLVEQDVNAASEMGTLGTDLQESALAIGELCAG